MSGDALASVVLFLGSDTVVILSLSLPFQWAARACARALVRAAVDSGPVLTEDSGRWRLQEVFSEYCLRGMRLYVTETMRALGSFVDMATSLVNVPRMSEMFMYIRVVDLNYVTDGGARICGVGGFRELLEGMRNGGRWWYDWRGNRAVLEVPAQFSGNKIMG